MSFGFLGIQFGFALQNANTSYIFSLLGAGVEELPALWLAAPITGMFVQPIIGYYSDRTWHPTWGRRRPYFTIGAILASIALFMMPNSPTLWIAAGTLWVMDASINVSMEPFRAFVGDMSPPSQRTVSFAMQSFFIGTGAVVASMLPWIFDHWMHVSTSAEGGSVPDNVKYSFYLGGAMFFITVMWTVFSTKEYPPTPQAEQALRNREKRKIEDETYFMDRFLYIGISLLCLGVIISGTVKYYDLPKEMYVLGGGFIIFAIIHFISSIYIQQDRSYVGIVHMVKDFHTMPKTMVQLTYVQFFSWAALFSMWVYATPAIASHIFHTTDVESPEYGEGQSLVTFLFGVYNGVAALTAFLLPVLARYTSRRITHLVALTAGGAGLISIYYIQDPDQLWISMVGVGIAWSSILSVPYAMLSGALPPEKMGYYMGVFNLFVVIPQIIAGTLLGVLVRYAFDGSSIHILITGGVSMIIAGLLSLRVKDEQEITIKT
jgi:maltose/moltooligosaccharide transporter